MTTKDPKDRTNEVEQELISILFTMEVPMFRLQSKDWGWMVRNLQIRNKDHLKFDRAREILTKLLRDRRTQDRDSVTRKRT